MNEITALKQICSRIINKNKKIIFVGIITAKAKLITGASKDGFRNLIIPSKIRKYQSWYEIIAFINNCDLNKIWCMREVIYVTLENSESILVIMPLTIDKKFVVFLINNKENNDLVPTIEKILYELC